MKTVFVHDWLIYPWWADKVLFDIVEWSLKLGDDFVIKWNKTVFTVFFDEDFELPDGVSIVCVFKNRFILRYYRWLMPFFPVFMKILSMKIRKCNPDRVIVSSYAVAKNIDFNWKKI